MNRPAHDKFDADPRPKHSPLDAKKTRQLDIEWTYQRLRDLEKRHGQTAVLSVLRKWLNNPERGQF